MPTTPEMNIWTPASVDDYHLTVDLATMAQTVEEGVLDELEDRVATPEMIEEGTDDEHFVTPWTLLLALQSSHPKIASGSVTMTFTNPNTTASQTVNFPPGLFSEAPWVQAIPWSAAPQSLSPVTVTALSKDSATFHMRRDSATNTDIRWIAIEVAT